MSARSLEGPFRGAGSLTLNGAPYTVSLATGRAQENAGLRVKGEVTPTNRPVNFAFDGQLQVADAAPEFDGRFTIAGTDKGLTFKSGVLDWKSMCVGTITDASHGEEEEWVEEMKTLEPYRSQGGRLNVLATMDLVKGEECHFHLISWASQIIKRVVRATIQGEA